MTDDKPIEEILVSEDGETWNPSDDRSLEERLIPVLDQVLIRSLDVFKSETLHLPEAYEDDCHGSNKDMIRDRNQLCLGIVIRAGPGWKYDGKGHTPLDVKTGDHVMYNRADAKIVEGTDAATEGCTPLVMTRNHAIFAVVKGPARQIVGGLVTP